MCGVVSPSPCRGCRPADASVDLHAPTGHGHHQFDGNGAGRQGSKKTRYGALPWNKGKNEIKANYYAMTATEIFPITVNNNHRRELMVVTARLCHQALAWKHRTRYPIPLHAALQMDKDPPQCRRTITPEDLDGEMSGEDE
ncbi:RNaseH domain-containing protein [Streptomyces sp. NPDC006197]|uniref:RNaseH domain-containing protein n=1 Tax=Streptomyces sp. NPDC006197 TaxID=3156685 RepID=UPI0033ADDF38